VEDKPFLKAFIARRALIAAFSSEDRTWWSADGRRVASLVTAAMAFFRASDIWHTISHN